MCDSYLCLCVVCTARNIRGEHQVLWQMELRRFREDEFREGKLGLNSGNLLAWKIYMADCNQRRNPWERAMILPILRERRRGF